MVIHAEPNRTREGHGTSPVQGTIFCLSAVQHGSVWRQASYQQRGYLQVGRGQHRGACISTECSPGPGSPSDMLGWHTRTPPRAGARRAQARMRQHWGSGIGHRHRAWAQGIGTGHRHRASAQGSGAVADHHKCVSGGVEVEPGGVTKDIHAPRAGMTPLGFEPGALWCTACCVP